MHIKKLLYKILAISKSNGLKNLECSIIGEIGSVYQSENNPLAKDMFNKQLKMAIEQDDKPLYCLAMNYLSNYYYFNGEYEKGYQSALKSLAIATKCNNDVAVFNANSHIAQYGIFTHNFNISEEALNKNIEFSERKKLKSFLAHTLSKLGYIKCRQKSFSVGIVLLEKGLALSKHIGDRFNESKSYSLLGQSFIIKHDYKKAAFYLNKAVKIIKVIDNNELLITAYGNLITCYNELCQFNKAFNYACKKYEAVKHTRNKLQIALALGKIGSCAFNTYKFANALKYYFLQLEILKKTDAVFHKALALSNIGHVYLEYKDYAQAKSYYIKAEKFFLALHNQRYLDMLYIQLTEVCKQAGEIKDFEKYAILCKINN